MIKKYLPYSIHDDLVPLDLQDKLLNTVFCQYKNYHLPLHYRNNITGLKNSKKNPFEEGFGETIYGKNNKHQHAGLFLSPLYSITEKLNITIWELYNVRVFMLIAKGNKNITTYPHTDLPFPHLVCLYYINDTDGDTVLYGKGKKEEIYRVTPKKGRCIIFDGGIYHASSTPTLANRAIINYNFFPMEDKPQFEINK